MSNVTHSRPRPHPRPISIARSEPILYVGDSRNTGRGIFAARSIAAGERVLVFRGPLLHEDEVTDFSLCLEISRGLFLGPSGGPDDLVNHSCRPNCAVRLEDAGAALHALRQIETHEEVTFDYSTTMVRDRTMFECGCGSPECRGSVGTFRTLPPAVRRRYARLAIVPPFVIACGRMRRNGGRTPTSGRNGDR
jgi:hypothetical protein